MSPSGWESERAYTFALGLIVLSLNAAANATGNIEFKCNEFVSCTDEAGGSLSGKCSGTLEGIFQIKGHTKTKRFPRQAPRSGRWLMQEVRGKVSFHAGTQGGLRVNASGPAKGFSVVPKYDEEPKDSTGNKLNISARTSNGEPIFVFVDVNSKKVDVAYKANHSDAVLGFQFLNCTIASNTMPSQSAF